MEAIFFIVMQRMRTPLLALIITHAVTVLGLTLIPGVDADGNPWHMDFFHAVYFVSFMATTIGFGEIPHAFSDAQRLWVIFSIYATVVVWIYSIGSLIRLVQDPALRRAVIERRFSSVVRRLRDSFYLVCGYGETGGILVRALTDHGHGAVVIDANQECLDLLHMDIMRMYVPALCGDAGKPENMLKAGLSHPLCAGVVALSNKNELNLKIAITAKLIHKDIQVICRADSHDVEANMGSFGTDYIIDPFDTFSLHLATAFQAPCLHLIQEWLSGMPGDELDEPIYPPHEGLWVVCGFGRFGRAVYNRLRDQGIDAVVIEANPDIEHAPPPGYITGRGTEADTLLKANIDKAVGLVSGTDDDVNNLSIIMTARELNPKLFVVARQNRRENQALFDAVHADMVMYPSSIVAEKIRVLLVTPMLAKFIGLALFKDDSWACELASRIAALVGTHSPAVWEFDMQPEFAEALCAETDAGSEVTLGAIMLHPRDREQQLPCISLLHISGDSRTILPDPSTVLKPGDRLLCCGRPSVELLMQRNLQSKHVLSYLLTGEVRVEGLLWRMLRRQQEGEKKSA